MRAGLVAELSGAEALCAATRRLRDAGYRDLDAFSPRPVAGLDEILGLRRTRLNWVAFAVGMTMAGLAFGIQWFCNVWSYPLDSGGRPPFAIPAFIPITFEAGVLFASFASFFGLFSAIGLPRLYHPLFDVEGFDRASSNGYFLAVGRRDPKFDPEITRRDLEDAGASTVSGFGGVES
jgi:hypothetical protein